MYLYFLIGKKAYCYFVICYFVILSFQMCRLRHLRINSYLCGRNIRKYVICLLSRSLFVFLISIFYR